MGHQSLRPEWQQPLEFIVGVAPEKQPRCHKTHLRNSGSGLLPPTKAALQTIQGEHPEEQRELTREGKPSEQVAQLLAQEHSSPCREAYAPGYWTHQRESLK